MTWFEIRDKNIADTLKVVLPTAYELGSIQILHNLILAPPDPPLPPVFILIDEQQQFWSKSIFLEAHSLTGDSSGSYGLYRCRAQYGRYSNMPILQVLIYQNT